jgi:hypothetical protein
MDRWQERLSQSMQPDSVHGGEQMEMEMNTQRQVPGFRGGMIVEAVKCPQWGPGKIVHIGNCLHIVFRDGPGKMARTFPVDTTKLIKASIQSDPRLDNLPPLIEKDGNFQFRVEPLSFEDAMKTFRRHFPGAFADPKYTSGERLGKDQAHQQFQEQLGLETLRTMLANDDIAGLIKLALAVKSPVVEMLSRFENAALHDALQDIDSSRTFFSTLLQLLESPAIDQAVFKPYIDAVNSLPVKKGKAATWPIATLFPHIAQPDRHMFLKPEAARAAAERLGFNLKYETALNWETYSALLRMGETYLGLLKESGAKDFVDVQSFLFVANGGYDK